MHLRSLLQRRARLGFTLIELLLVIGIIAILASIVIVAINPTRQLGQSRNAQRESDVNTLLNAIYQYTIDNNGNLPGTLSGSTNCLSNSCQICKNHNTTNCGAAGTVSAYIARQLTGAYIVSMPFDPRYNSATSTGYTGYSVRKDAQGRITVSANQVEAGASPISVTR